MNTNERSAHPSQSQIEALLGYLENNPSIAKGFSKVASARDAARRHWERLAIQLNSMGGSTKSWKQWTKYWADKKSAVKKKAALRSAVRRRTGGGMEQVERLTEVEERIICLMGGENFATGDTHLAIRPFIESQTMEDESLTLPVSVSLEEPAMHTLMEPQTMVEESLTVPVSVSLGEPAIHTLVNTIADVNCVPGTSYPSARQSYISDVAPTMAGSTLPSPRQLSPRTRSPRRRRRTVIRVPPPSPPSQRRSQFTSIVDRFLRMEEQRLELDRQNSERLFETNSAISRALNLIGEALKMLAERR